MPKTLPERILLTVPSRIQKKLKRDQKIYGYFSVQEVILELLRDTYLRKDTVKKGRPKKPRESDILKRKKIFG